MEYDQRLADGIVLDDELSDKYKDGARRRAALARIVESATEAIMSQRPGENTETRSEKLKDLCDWTQSEEAEIMDENDTLWAAIVKRYALDVTAPYVSLTIHEIMLSNPMVYYYPIGKEIWNDKHCLPRRADANIQLPQNHPESENYSAKTDESD